MSASSDVQPTVAASKADEPKAVAGKHAHDGHEYKGPGSEAAQRTVVDLQAELTAAREELAANIAALKAEANPGAIAARAGQGVVNYFRTPEGGVNVKRAAIVGGVVVGFIALRVLTRRR